MSELPAPPVPADCDLRAFPYIPLEVVRIRDCGLTSASTGDEFRSAVLLWCASWHQLPASSLPNDERALAHLAGFGRDLRGWAKVREGAMRGWYLASDGLLYHRVVSQKAAEAWQARLEQRARTEAARLAREAKRKQFRPDVSEDAENETTDHVTTSVTETVTTSVTDHVTESKGREQKGREGKGLNRDAAAASSPREAAAASSPEDFPPDDPTGRPIEIVPPMSKTVGDLISMHGRIYVPPVDRESWAALLAEYGWDPLDDACRTLDAETPPGKRILLSRVSLWLSENYRRKGSA